VCESNNLYLCQSKRNFFRQNASKSRGVECLSPNAFYQNKNINFKRFLATLGQTAADALREKTKIQG
jgi:hypothetical protein